MTLDLELFATLPKTGSFPDARLNVLREGPFGSIFVNDLQGYLYEIDANTKQSTTYLDVAERFPQLKNSPGAASGFVSFAFHPDFAVNGKLYTIHSEFRHEEDSTAAIPPVGNFEQSSVLTEWTANEPTASVFSGSSRELLRIGTPDRFHPMGDVTFDPTLSNADDGFGLLHVSIGDGQSFNLGRSENLQRLDSYLGTILRIDPDPNGQPIVGFNGEYSIPTANPWAMDGQENTLAEILAYGFRNPHRLTWDHETGNLFATDIGEAHIEEVNRVVAGGNYGWPEREGTFGLAGIPIPNNEAEFDFHYPAAQYDHDEGRAISNAVIYRHNSELDSAFNSHDGSLIFGDIVNGRVFAADLDAAIHHDPRTLETVQIEEVQIYSEGSKTSFLEVVSASAGNNLNRVDLRFGSDASGAIYLMSKQTGQIYSAHPLSPFDCNFDGQLNEADLSCVCSIGATHSSQLLSAMNSLLGDLDLDGEVGFGDFLILSANYSSAPAEYLEGDLDCDGMVGFADFLLLADGFGSKARVNSSVPEPANGMWFCWIVSIAIGRFARASKTSRKPRSIGCASLTP